MLLGPLTLSVILITVGFQTASAIVMAEAEGHKIKFHVAKADGSLVWTDRDHHLDDVGYNLLHRPGGDFDVDHTRIIHSPERGPLKWDVIEQGFCLYRSAQMKSGSQGSVHYKPPQTPTETGTEIQDITDSKPEIGDNELVEVKIIYTAIEKDLFPPDPVRARVEKEQVWFYSNQDSQLRLIKKRPDTAYPYDGDVPIYPLTPTSRFYVDKASGSSIKSESRWKKISINQSIKRVYQSPFAEDPSWDAIKGNLYIAKAEWRTTSMGNVIAIYDPEMNKRTLNGYLKVDFGGDGSPNEVDDKISSG